MGKFVWLMEMERTREEWKYASTTSLAQSVMTFGTTITLLWSAVSWDSVEIVSCAVMEQKQL